MIEDVIIENKVRPDLNNLLRRFGVHGHFHSGMEQACQATFDELLKSA